MLDLNSVQKEKPTLDEKKKYPAKSFWQPRIGLAVFFCLLNKRIAAIVFFFFDLFVSVYCILVWMHRCCHHRRTEFVLFCFAVAFWAVMSCFHRSNVVWLLMIWYFGFQHNAFLPFSHSFSLASPIDTDCCGQILKVYRFHCEPKRYIKRILTSIPFFCRWRFCFKTQHIIHGILSVFWRFKSFCIIVLPSQLSLAWKNVISI